MSLLCIFMITQYAFAGDNLQVNNPSTGTPVILYSNPEIKGLPRQVQNDYIMAKVVYGKLYVEAEYLYMSAYVEVINLTNNTSDSYFISQMDNYVCDFSNSYDEFEIVVHFCDGAEYVGYANL